MRLDPPGAGAPPACAVSLLSWAAENWKTALVTTAVFVATAAAVTVAAPLVLGAAAVGTAGALAVAAGSLLIAGAASGAVGHWMDSARTGQPVTARGLGTAAAIGAAIGLVGGVAARAIAPCVQRLVSPAVAAALPASAPRLSRVVTAATTHATVGGGTGAGTQVGLNLATGRPALENVDRAAALGAGGGVVLGGRRLPARPAPTTPAAAAHPALASWIPPGAVRAPNGTTPLRGAIPRTHMPQLEIADLPAYRLYLARNGVLSRELAGVRTGEVRPMQRDANLGKVEAIARSLQADPHALDRVPVVLLRDPATGRLYAFDGNHRTMALMTTGVPAGRAIVIEGSPRQVLELTAAYPRVQYAGVDGQAAPPPPPGYYRQFDDFFQATIGTVTQAPAGASRGFLQAFEGGGVSATAGTVSLPLE